MTTQARSRLERQQRRVIEELTDRVATAESQAQQHNKERVAALDERARARNAERDAIATRDVIHKENNDLRRQLRERELDAERMRGYLDGLEDSQPPVMVEAPRDRKFGTYINRGRMDEVAGYAPYGQDKPTQWWERPKP